MPSISVDPVVDRAYMWVQVDWADIAAVTCIKVERVRTDNGTRTPLRAYIAPCQELGECLTLSNGLAVFYDTEPPLDIQFHYEATDCSGVITTVSSSDLLTLPSNSSFWLKDPVRPCHDIPVLVSSLNNCDPAKGTFFLQMQEELYRENSFTLLPNNSKYPVAISRTRRGATSTLILGTRKFIDRDAVLTINDPGSPLLFQGPIEYGIPDRYMSIGEVMVARGLPDHRYQPRLISLPHVQVDRPVGTTQGICGSRFMDLCDTFATWADVTTAGLTSVDLVKGEASQPGLDQRDWIDVETGFANWLAVEGTGRTWRQLREGL